MVNQRLSPRERAEVNRKRALVLRKRAALKSVGASSWKEVDQWVKSGQGNGRLKSRPALQVCPYTWASNLQSVSIGAAGGVYLFSSYSYGNGDYQRHTNEKMTYKMQIKMQLVIPNEYKVFVAKWPVYIWLIYDKSSNGSILEMKSLFDVKWPMKPGLFNINKDNCHRFVVKRRFKIMMSMSNTDNVKKWYQGMGDVSSDYSVDYSKFVKGLKPCLVPPTLSGSRPRMFSWPTLCVLFLLPYLSLFFTDKFVPSHELYYCLAA